MTMDVRQVLHTIHTATNDVLAGYGTMRERADPEISPVINSLNDLHRRHAVEQEKAIRTLQDTGEDDESFCGIVNKTVVTVRDWIAGLDVNALLAIRQGEQALMEIYDNTLAEWTVNGHDVISDLLAGQYHEIKKHVSELPVE